MANETAFALQNNQQKTVVPTILKFQKPNAKYTAQKQKALLAQQEKDRKAIMKEAKKRAEAARTEAMALKGYTKVTVKSILKHKVQGLPEGTIIDNLEQAIKDGATHIYILKTVLDQIKTKNKTASHKKAR